MAAPQPVPEGAGPAEVVRSFWCFISYRHADNAEPGREWASWLHRELETYPVPTELVGSVNARGETVPARIYPVFRDEEELPAHADLSAAIVQALELSLNLVVICSPRARESRFVNEEVRRFKAMGKSDRTIGMVIRGDSRPGSPEDCLPLPLVRRVDGTGAVLAAEDAPVLVDLRVEGADEEWIDPAARLSALRAAGLAAEVAAGEVRFREDRLRESKLRIIAHVLGLDPALLAAAEERRERGRRRRRRLLAAGWAAASLAILLLGFVGLRAYRAFEQDGRVSSGLARDARAKAEQLARDTEEKRRVAEALAVENLRKDGLTFLATQRFAEAAKALGEASARGDAIAALELARLRLSGKQGRPNVASALPLLEKAVAAGNTPAMVLLGSLLAERTPAERERAVALLREAVRLGEPGAELALCRVILRSHPAEATERLRRLAEGGDGQACWLLAVELRRAAPSVGNPLPEWVGWVLRAADRGVLEARRERGALAWAGDPGLSARIDPAVRARSLDDLLSLSASGDQDARRTLEKVYARPASYPSDSGEALAFALKGAYGGFRDAMLFAARALAAEARSGGVSSGDDATKWYLRLIGPANGSSPPGTHAALAASELGGWYANMAAGTSDARLVAHYRESACHYLGVAAGMSGSPSDMVAAAKAEAAMGSREASLRWLGKAEAAGSGEARRLMAVHLLTHNGDSQAALALLRKGVELGDPEAAAALADWMFSYARDPAQRRAAAEVCLEGAALGSGWCAARLALLLRDLPADGIDPARACRALRAGAETGDPACMLELGRVLLAGKFAHGTRAEAHAWLSLASRLGLARESAPLLAGVEQSMGPTERAASEDLQAAQLRRRPPAGGASR